MLRRRDLAHWLCDTHKQLGKRKRVLAVTHEEKADSAEKSASLFSAEKSASLFSAFFTSSSHGMPSVKHTRVAGMTANDVLKTLNLKKMAVRDDGRCWIYVVMAALGQYNVKPKRGRVADPTDRELIVAQTLCESISHEFPSVVKAPDYEGRRNKNDFFGTYGGPEQWQVLAPMLNMIVILWDPRDTAAMNDSKKLFYYIATNGRLFWKTPHEIFDLISNVTDYTTIVHAAWSNTIDAHFDVYML